MHGSQTKERNLFENADDHLKKLLKKWGGIRCDEHLYYGV
jgi:hypothetical protein